jgi:DNA replication licensing factor MCM4
MVDVENGVIEEPTRCMRPECMQGSMQIVHGSCVFYNKQAIRLQETPDSVPDGQTPHTVTLLVYDEMLDCVKPGDRYIKNKIVYQILP